MKITEQLVEDVAFYLMTKACIELPDDVVAALERALKEESDPVAVTQLESILKNVQIAKQRQKSICQDTGVPMFYVDYGMNCMAEGDLRAAITRGTARASDRVPMRHNVVHPLTLENNRNNTGWGVPIVFWDVVPNCDYVELTAVPKGFGAEMRSAHGIVYTSENIKDAVRRCVMDMVEDSMGEPCPPVIIGVGVGGLTDSVMNVAKRSMFRSPVGVRNPDPMVAQIEEELLAEINGLNLGPMGLGGKNYALAVNIDVVASHASTVAIGVSLQCWCARYSTARIYCDGKVEFITHPNGGCK